ncbi:MAG: hypothetical protein AAF354_12950 [Pseudomonadota bacterium]
MDGFDVAVREDIPVSPVGAQENRDAAAEKMTTVIAELRAAKLRKAADLLEEP